MPLTERLHILVSPDMRKQLAFRAGAEGKSIGHLVREFTQAGLLRPSRAERIRIAEEMRALCLPVDTVAKMKEEAIDGRLKR